MVVRFNLKHAMDERFVNDILTVGCSGKGLREAARQNRGVVRISDLGPLGGVGMGGSNHGEKRKRTGLPVDRPTRVKNLVPAVFGIGLRKHQQFDIGRVTAQRHERPRQVLNLILRERQSKAFIGSRQFDQCLIGIGGGGNGHRLHGFAGQFIKYARSLGRAGPNLLGHPIMQRANNLLNDLLAMVLAQSPCKQPNIETDAVFEAALNAQDAGQTAVSGDIRGFARPWRNGALARTDPQRGTPRALRVGRFPSQHHRSTRVSPVGRLQGIGKQTA